MPRFTYLDDVLFPVEEYTVCVSIRIDDGKRRLPVPDKKAIINCDRVRGRRA
jgi:hypothetical protein